MQLTGDKKLSKWFILVLFVWAVFVGEIVPVWIQTLEGVSADEAGAKESMFESWDMFIPTVVLYILIAVVFCGILVLIQEALLAMGSFLGRSVGRGSRVCPFPVPPGSSLESAPLSRVFVA